MDRDELLRNVESYGRQLLVTKEANLNDLATGTGMALLALAELLRVQSNPVTQPGPPETVAGGFKAKANRW